MAGGLGTRVAHLLPGIPKPMAPVAGRPFLEWVTRFLAAQGVKQAIFSTGHLSEVIERHFAENPVTGISTQCVREAEPLGTAGGFVQAAGVCESSPPAWLVLNGDSLVLADLAPALKVLNEPGVDGVLVGCAVPDATRYGTLAMGANGELLRFDEKRPGRGVINAGVYFLKHSLLARFPKRKPLSFEVDVFPECVRQGALLKVATVEAPFLDIGTPDSLKEAEEFVKQNARYF